MTRKVFSGLEVSSELHTDDDGNWESLNITVIPTEQSSDGRSIEEIIAELFDNECNECDEPCEGCELNTEDLGGDIIEPGDVVKLLSGGPDMTVSSIHDDEDGGQTADCYWFNGSALNCRMIPVAALDLAY